MVQVVAALIWQGDRFLICRRPENKTRALLWEFVGGKVEKGESKAQALVRECMEELDVLVEVGGEFMTVVHEYPDMTVELTLFHARIQEGCVRMKEHAGVCFITPDEIPRFDFCPADVEILACLQSGAGYPDF